MFFMKRVSRLAAVVLMLCALTACNSSARPTGQQAAGQLPVASMPKIDQQKLLEHIKVLSSDEYEGRAPGSKGEELTVKYIQDQFKQLNLKPGNPDGTYLQKVPLVGVTGSDAKPLTLTKGGKRETFKW